MGGSEMGGVSQVGQHERLKLVKVYCATRRFVLNASSKFLQQ